MNIEQGISNFEVLEKLYGHEAEARFITS